MTEKELSRLKRAELLEMLLEQSREVERLNQELEEAKQALQDRTIKIDNAGSVAEAALQINGVFEAAQAAAQQYIDNVERLCGERERACQNLEEECRMKIQKKLEETDRQCEERKNQLEKKWVEKIRKIVQECDEGKENQESDSVDNGTGSRA